MHRKLLSVFLALALVAPALAQNVADGPVTKITSGASKNSIDEDLIFGSGRTLTVAGGGTLSGAGSFDFHLGTLTFGAGQIPLSALANDAITIAGHLTQLGGSVAIGAADVGLGSVTNDAQTKASIVPNTAPTPGQVLIGNSGGTAYSPVSLSGDVTISSSGAATVTIPWSAIISGTPTTAAGYGITAGAALDAFAAAQSGTAQNVTTSASPTFAGASFTGGSSWSWQSLSSDARIVGATSGANFYISPAGAGGISLGSTSSVQSAVYVGYSADSTSSTTGALQVRGGAGIAKALNVGSQVKIGTGTGVGQQMLNVAPASGGNAWAVLNRPDNTQLAIVQFATGATPDWGLGEVAGGTSDWALFNYGTSANAITVARATSAVTLANTLTVNGSGPNSFGGPVKLPSFTVSTLPSASTSGAGATVYVTDLTSITAGTTATGGGSLKHLVTSDGTNWVVQ